MFLPERVIIGFLPDKNIKISIKKLLGDPPYPPMQVLGGQGMYFQNLSSGSETSDMTSYGLGEMFEGDFADTENNNEP